jgi:polyhydroxyalkanoate synthesis regulator phasin
MNTKRFSSLVSLSVQLYLLSRDERFRADVAKLITILRQKARKVVENMDTDKQEAVHEAYHRISEIATALENKMKKAVSDLYEKLHIANTTDVNNLSAELSELTRDLHTLEDRLTKLERENK